MNDNKYQNGACQVDEISDGEAIRLGRRVTWTGFAVNVVLGAVKVTGGIAGRSGALIADGLHSISDLVTDVIVLAVVGISRRKPDSDYQYGRGKYETVATFLVALILMVVSAGLFIDGLEKIYGWVDGAELERPSSVALAIIFLSILSKEWLFRYTRNVGRRIHSAAVTANAWHHRSDAMSSVATLIGVGGAVLLSPRWRVLDPAAMMVVAIFIAIAGMKMLIPAVKELLEASLPEEDLKKIKEITASSPGVICYHHLRSRRNGNRIIIDLHIKVNPEVSVSEGHSTATQLEHKLERSFGGHSIINIHVEPYKGEDILQDGSCA